MELCLISSHSMFTNFTESFSLNTSKTIGNSEKKGTEMSMAKSITVKKTRIVLISKEVQYSFVNRLWSYFPI